MRRYELTEFKWKVIEPLLPNKPRGVPRLNDRRGSMASSGASAPARPGATSPSAMGPFHHLLQSVRALA